MRATVSLFVLASLAPVQAAAQIEHSAVACIVAGQFPAIEARVARSDQVAKARTYFHADEDARWYYVEMKRAGETLRGVLPKPLATIKVIHYYIEVTDKAAGQSRTADYAPAVVADAGSCSGKGVVAAAAVASKVAVAAPAGAAAAPSGFAAGTVAAAGGGIGATALVVTGLAVAAGGAAVVAAKGGDEGSDDVAGPEQNQPVTIGGIVYSDPCCPPGPVDPNLRANSRRIAGALIGTSLDSATTTSDAQGAFRLTTQTRCDGTAATTSYTLRISAAGCDTLNLPRQWSCSFEGSQNALNLACR